MDGGREHSFVHDLNFAQARYDIKHVVAFKKPTTSQITALRLSGPIPGEEIARKKTAGDETPMGSGGGVAPPAKKRKSGFGGKDKLVTASGISLYGIVLTKPGIPRTTSRRNQTDQRQRHVRTHRDHQRQQGRRIADNQ